MNSPEFYLIEHQPLWKETEEKLIAGYDLVNGKIDVEKDQCLRALAEESLSSIASIPDWEWYDQSVDLKTNRREMCFKRSSGPWTRTASYF